MRVAPEYQQDASALGLLHLQHAAGGEQVPLSSLTRGRHRASGPLSVNHTGQLPSVTLSFNLRPGVALGDAVGAGRGRRRSPSCRRSIATSFQGTAQAFQDSTRGLGLILIMAIFVIYVVLGILYESFIHPLTILSGLPAAGLGALRDAAGLRRRSQSLRVRRRHHARRPREEERHHDDRLRDRGAAHARQVAGRGDVRSVPRALPADHDDDDGGAGRHAADRAGHGRRRRVAAAARPGGRRRPARVADADALHHAGLLSVHGSAVGLARAGSEPAVSVRSSVRTACRDERAVDASTKKTTAVSGTLVTPTGLRQARTAAAGSSSRGESGLPAAPAPARA